MDEPIQSEVRKRKNKYMGSRKTVLMNIFAGKEWRCRCREQLVDTVGEGEGRTN